MTVANDYANDIFNRIMEHVTELCEVNKKGTATSREIQTSVRLSLPGLPTTFFPTFLIFFFNLSLCSGELAKHAVSEGTKAVTKFFSSMGCGGNRKTSQSAKAGLVFPVGRIKTLMKHKFSGRIGRGAPVYMAAVLEYMVFVFVYCCCFFVFVFVFFLVFRLTCLEKNRWLSCLSWLVMPPETIKKRELFPAT